jgi:hypothetical protein
MNNVNNMQYTCHSGGCPGADMMWETEGEKYGVKTISYSFYNHQHKGKNPKVLTALELQEGFEAVMRANKTLKRSPQGQPQYIQNLLARNWFQVKNAEAVFAIAKKFLTRHTVDGGTGWAVQMAVDCDKPVFVFLQDVMGGGWFRYMPVVGFEGRFDEIPTLTKNFAGIGTREINQHGIQAIQAVYKNTMTSLNDKQDRKTHV